MISANQKPAQLSEVRFARFFLAAHLILGGIVFAESSDQRKGVVFGEPDRQRLRLDIRYPKAEAPAGGYPLIISIHGGGWIMGSRTKDFFLRSFTTDGYAVACIDYRLSSTARFPAQIEDCRLALRWIIDHAAEYWIDPHRIGLTGASAGGHLALLLGLAASHRFVADGTPPFPSDNVRAICAFYPPTDLIRIIPADRREQDDNLVAKLLGGPVAKRLDLAREGSPVTYVRADAPATLLIQGDRDPIVPLDQSETLVAALRSAGAESQLLIYAGSGHAFSPTPKTRVAILAFFNRHLKP